MPPGDPVVATRDLTKKYGKLVALDRLTMSVDRGQILGRDREVAGRRRIDPL